MNLLTVKNIIMSEMNVTMSMSQNEGRNFPGFLAEMNRFSRFPTETSQFQKRFTIEIRNFDASPDVSPKKGPGPTIDSAVDPFHRHPVQGVTWS